jgi:hypothetical protein
MEPAKKTKAPVKTCKDCLHFKAGEIKIEGIGKCMLERLLHFDTDKCRNFKQWQKYY